MKKNRTKKGSIMLLTLILGALIFQTPFINSTNNIFFETAEASSANPQQAVGQYLYGGVMKIQTVYLNKNRTNDLIKKLEAAPTKKQDAVNYVVGFIPGLGTLLGTLTMFDTWDKASMAKQLRSQLSKSGNAGTYIETRSSANPSPNVGYSRTINTWNGKRSSIKAPSVASPKKLGQKFLKIKD